MAHSPKEVAEILQRAQNFDLCNRPPNQGWTRVSDPQLLRLLVGAGVISLDDAVKFTVFYIDTRTWNVVGTNTTH